MLLRHILAGYDGSARAQRALDLAIRLAEAGGGTKLTIVHAVNLMPAATGDLAVALTPAMERTMLERAAALLAEAEERASAVVRVRTELLLGPPAKAILNHADAIGCDLILIGGRERGLLRRFLLGSVSHDIVCHAKVPVLVYKYKSPQ